MNRFKIISGTNYHEIEKSFNNFLNNTAYGFVFIKDYKLFEVEGHISYHILYSTSSSNSENAEPEA